MKTTDAATEIAMLEGELMASRSTTGGKLTLYCANGDILDGTFACMTFQSGVIWYTRRDVLARAQGKFSLMNGKFLLEGRGKVSCQSRHGDESASSWPPR